MLEDVIDSYFILVSNGLSPFSLFLIFLSAKPSKYILNLITFLLLPP